MLSISKLRTPLALIAFAFTVANANAAITVTFSFDGNDTIGVISGSITLPQTPASDNISGGFFPYVGAGENELYVHLVGAPSYDSYAGGTHSQPIPLPRIGTQFSGPRSFGFSNAVLYTDYDAIPGTTYVPTGTFIWPNRTLAQVGVSQLTDPIVVYTASNGEEIRFVTVPEPGLPSLVLVGTTLAAATIRRRNRCTKIISTNISSPVLI